MNMQKTLGAALLAATLAGCTAGPLGNDFGSAHVQNLSSQQVDPTATTRAHPPQAVDGRKLEQATTRYRTEKSESTTRGKLVSETGN